MKNSRTNAWFVWALLGVLVAGLLLGILLGRDSARTAVGDLLTSLSLFVLGMATAAGLVAFGWFIGGRRADSGEGTTRSAIHGRGQEQLVAPSAAVPAGEAVETPPVVTPAVEAGQAATVPAPQVTHDSVLSLGSHLALFSGNGKIGFRIHNAFGYKNLQVGVGLNPAWTTRLATPAGRLEAARESRAWFTRKESLAQILFIGALVVYAITRLVGLSSFPINFFADEANQVMNAVNLVKHGFRDARGDLFPVYIQLFSYYYPDISVYLQALTSSLFGVSIEVARGTTGVLTLCTAAALGVMMREVFKARYWWAIVLLLGIAPAWFLWSRTAFDPIAMAALYGLTIVAYLLYRYRSPSYLYITILVAAATFYAYPTGQPAIAVLALLLAISDWRYHWENRMTLLKAIPVVVIAIIPVFRFWLAHPDETTAHLHAVNSFLLQDTSVADKFSHWLSLYLDMLSPLYWFTPVGDQGLPDLMRHVMKGYGFLPLVELPLFLIGLIVCIRYVKESKYRAVLACLLAAPVGAAVTDPAIIRLLAFIVPATLVSALGLEWLLTRIKGVRAALVTSLAAFALLSAMGLAMLDDALTNGPTWFSDYTLYGMQWGARQVFVDNVPQLAEANPDDTIYVSDTWANGTGIFVDFFGLAQSNVQVRSIVGWLEKKMPLDPNTIFIMTPDEYQKASTSPKFKNVEAEKTIPYPNGDPGFYVTRLQYADNVDQVFAAERAELLKLVTEPVVIDGQTAQLSHTKFDIGQASDMFDNDPLTVARCVEANPAILDFKFGQPRTLTGLSAYFGRANVRVVAKLYTGDSATPTEYTADFRYAQTSTELNSGPLAEMNFENAPANVTRLYLEIRYPEADDTAHAHIFEMKFR